MGHSQSEYFAVAEAIGKVAAAVYFSANGMNTEYLGPSIYQA